jgi:hypothetical protein
MSQPNIKHLEFIQAVITRMNTNSFQLKGWMITIVAALLAIFASTRNALFVLVAVFPVLIFWFLDTYYLMQERKFRGLYNDVAGVTEEPKEIQDFAMRPDLYTGGTYAYKSALTSPTIVWLYMPLLVGLVCAFIHLK